MRIREACESDVEGMARVVLSADDAFRSLLPEDEFVTYEESVTNWRRCLRKRPYVVNSVTCTTELGYGWRDTAARLGPDR